MNCKNCGQTVEGKFCNHCGQNTKVSRINFSNFISEFVDNIFQINRGFFFTMKELTLRPGHSIRDYVNGKRMGHFKPIAYAFTLSTIYFLLTKFLGNNTFISDALEGFSSYSSDSESAQREQDGLAFFQWLAKNYAYTMILLLPVYALATYLAFRTWGLNYLEHFVLNAYVIGQQSLIYVVSALFLWYFGDAYGLVLIFLLIGLAYTFYVFLQFFNGRRTVHVVLRSIIAYLLYILLPILVLTLVFVISMYM